MSRVAKRHPCSKCGAHIRSGLDDDACALSVRVDDEPLTRNGELLAILAGRKTYMLVQDRLYRRDHWSIRKAAEYPVADHRCWEPLPLQWLQPPPPPPPAPTDDPGF